MIDSKQIKTDFRGLVLADATVYAAVAGRLYPVQAPQGATLPYGVFEITASEDFIAHDGKVGTVTKVIDMVFWGTGQDALDDITDAVEAAVGGQRTTHGATEFLSIFRDDEDEGFLESVADGEGAAFYKRVTYRVTVCAA